jgi:monooxygenase
VEHLDVLVVGAGLSGVAAGHYLNECCPWASYAVLEARGAIGGTWDLFRYPGIRSDSDMFTLGYSFRPWDGDKAISDGASILRYIEETAAASGVDARIRFHHRVVSAEWSSDEARWLVTAERADTGETVRLACGFLFACTGYYRYEHGYQPELPGVARFEGTLVHPQAWPGDLDTTGKRVVVIGSGATAVTLVPALAETAAHVTMLQRSPTYIVSLPSRDRLADLLRRTLPERWSGPAVRWMKALTTQASYRLSRLRPQLVKRLLRAQVERQLPPGYDVDTHFAPRYDPWDQRLCVVPDGDLFAAICSGRASVVTDQIATFTGDGIELRSGATLDADVVVTATGLDLVFLGGMSLAVDGEPVDPADRLTYRGMMVEGVPNLAVAIGYTNASWTLKAELICDYTCRVLDHLHRTGLRRCMPVNRMADGDRLPLLGLTSGYVQRTVDRFPKQGTRSPWVLHQSYLRDYLEMRRAPVDDGSLVFSDPAPVPTVGAGSR